MNPTQHRRLTATLGHLVLAVRIQAHLIIRSHQGRCGSATSSRHSQHRHTSPGRPRRHSQPLLNRRQHIPLKDKDQEDKQSLQDIDTVRDVPHDLRLRVN